MKQAHQERIEAAKLRQGNVIRVLLEQHARIRDLFAAVKDAQGERKVELFGELRALLAVHEAAEEMVLRPISRQCAGAGVVEARNHEEQEAARALAELERLDPQSLAFNAGLIELEQAVSSHADHEEREEFPSVLAERSETELKHLGSTLTAAERVAPTHPHPAAAGSPSAQWVVGPFAGMLDRARDVFRG